MFRDAFMQRALLEAVLLGVLCSVTGVVVLLRRQAFAVDALSHTVFPGLAIGFAAGDHLFIGACVAAAASILLLSLLARVRRLDGDSILAVLIASFVAVGVAVVSRRPSFQSDLDALLFGRLLTVDRIAIIETAAVGIVVLAIVAALSKELVLVSFDVEAAMAQGFHVGAIDVALNAMVAATVVVAAQTVGAALTVPMVVLPAAIARTISDRLGRIVAVAIAVGVAGGVGGLAIAYQLSVTSNVRVGPSAAITVLLTLAFCGGLATRRWRT